MKILLIRLDHLGDLILTTPLIRALAKSGHSVDLVCPRWLTPILDHNPYLNESFAMEDIVQRFPVQWWDFGNWLRAQDYDCLLLPNPKPRQMLWSSWMSRAPLRLAMQAGIWGRLTGHRCLRIGSAFDQGRHFTDLQLDFARALHVPTDGLKPDYFCLEEEVLQARDRISSAFPGSAEEPVVGIHPGTSGNTCNLPPSVYGELASIILDRTNWRIILTGSNEEQSLINSWPQGVLASSRVYNGMGALDLRSLAAVITQMSGYVIGSTGPLHLASVFGVPTVSPFCPLAPINFQNWGDVTGLGACLQPSAAGCRQWRAAARICSHCDLRGEVTAEDIWRSLKLK